MSTVGVKKNKRRFKPIKANTTTTTAASTTAKRKQSQPENNSNEQQSLLKKPCHESTPSESSNTNTPLIVQHQNEETPSGSVTSSTTPTITTSNDTTNISSSSPSPSHFRVEIPSLNFIQTTLQQYPSIDKRKRRPLQGKSKEKLIELAQEVQQDEKERHEKMCAEKSPAHIPQVKIVNGEIVLDKSTLYSNVDEEQEEPNVVDEGAFVRMKRGPKRTPQRWTEQETDLFLELLKEHGQDFTSISQGIPGKTIDQVRRKFKSEYKRYTFI